MMTLGSLFDGIGGLPPGGSPLRDRASMGQ